MDFLRRLFSRSATPQPSGHVVPALPDRTEWFEEDEGLPYPDWEQIDGWIADHVDADDFDEGYNHAVRLWLTKLADPAGPGLTLSESTHFILLSPFESSGRKWTLKMLENARRTILHALGTLAWSDGWGKGVVLIMDHDSYNLYISHYFPGDYMGRTAGVMITGGGFAHIAAQAPQKQNFSDTPLFRILSQTTHHAPERFRRFVSDAHFSDAGEASAHQHFGFSLGEAASEFLGEGDWEPQPLRW